MADGLTIPEKWTFRDAAVAAAFDKHVREQLPWYDLATGAVAHFVRAFLPEGGLAIDLGASTGNIGRAIAPALAERRAQLIAFDPAAEMVDLYDAPGEILCEAAERVDFAALKPDVVVAFLCFQFLRPAARQAVIARICAALPPGGACVVVDRMTPVAGYIGQTVGRLTLAAKYEAGAAPDAILKKELSLVGVQRPLDPSELPGFHEIFRFGDFAAWVFEKQTDGAPVVLAA